MPNGNRRWRSIERLGLIAILLGFLGLSVVYGPTLLARYAIKRGDLPVLNLPFSVNTEVGVDQQQFQTNVAQSPYRLDLPSIGVTTNVVPDVPIDDEGAYWKALTQGVALAATSADLEADTGNSFIFGHSGRITLRPSPYDTIFARLPDVKEGDDVIVTVNGTVSHFRVTSSRSVAADDRTVLADHSGKRTITLMTCWPAGTWYKRWVVQAELTN